MLSVLKLTSIRSTVERRSYNPIRPNCNAIIVLLWLLFARRRSCDGVQ